jgi:CHASE3 domain sensor protein
MDARAAAAKAHGWRSRRSDATPVRTATSRLIRIVSIAAVAALAYAGASRRMGSWDSDEQIRHRPATRATLTDLGSDVDELVGSSRAFVRTGEESHVDSFRATREEIPHLLERLRESTPEREWQRLVKLDRLIDERVRLAEEEIATRRREGIAASLNLIDSGRAERLTDAVHAALNQLSAGEPSRPAADQNWSSKSAWLRP